MRSMSAPCWAIGEPCGLNHMHSGGTRPGSTVPGIHFALRGVATGRWRQLRIGHVVDDTRRRRTRTWLVLKADGLSLLDAAVDGLSRRGASRQQQRRRNDGSMHGSPLPGEAYTPFDLLPHSVYRGGT